MLVFQTIVYNIQNTLFHFSGFLHHGVQHPAHLSGAFYQRLCPHDSRYPVFDPANVQPQERRRSQVNKIFLKTKIELSFFLFFQTQDENVIFLIFSLYILTIKLQIKTGCQGPAL